MPGQWKNFHIWRGRLPHWRADDVIYYITFRHSRDLDQSERDILLACILNAEGKHWDLLIVLVCLDRTEMMGRVRADAGGTAYELSKIVERAKSKAGKLILKRSGERFPPFYAESYDRIVRDDAEFEDRWSDLMKSESSFGDPSERPMLWSATSDSAV